MRNVRVEEEQPHLLGDCRLSDPDRPGDDDRWHVHDRQVARAEPRADGPGGGSCRDRFRPMPVRTCRRPLPSLAEDLECALRNGAVVLVEVGGEERNGRGVQRAGRSGARDRVASTEAISRALKARPLWPCRLAHHFMEAVLRRDEDPAGYGYRIGTVLRQVEVRIEDR